MRVVGIDLSLTATGIATAAGTEVLAADTRGCDRLIYLRDQIRDRCVDLHRFGGDLVVMEGYAYGKGNQAHQVGELGGVVRVALTEMGVLFVVVPPAVLKKYATGHGNAPKAEVLAAAIRRLGYDGHDDNEADALWLRHMALDQYDVFFSDPVVPASHRGALAKVDWPEIATAA